jgi:hypothetical protein
MENLADRKFRGNIRLFQRNFTEKVDVLIIIEILMRYFKLHTNFIDRDKDIDVDISRDFLRTERRTNSNNADIVYWDY